MKEKMLYFLNEPSAKQAYFDAIEMCARLASYSTALCLLKIGYGDYLERADELAHRDIIYLALSLRRLSEVIKNTELLKAMKVSAQPNITWETQSDFARNTTKQNDVWSLIGKIIHCREFLIIRDNLTLNRYHQHGSKKVAESKLTTEEEISFTESAKDLPAICLVKSDKKNVVLFGISDFVAVAVDYLDQAKDLLEDEGVLSYS